MAQLIAVLENNIILLRINLIFKYLLSPNNTYI